MNTLGIVLLILSIVIGLTIYILYRIGKKVKEKEALMAEWMDERKVRAKLDAMQKKYGKKSTPKVPSIKK